MHKNEQWMLTSVNQNNIPDVDIHKRKIAKEKELLDVDTCKPN